MQRGPQIANARSVVVLVHPLNGLNLILLVFAIVSGSLVSILQPAGPNLQSDFTSSDSNASIG